jgi:hypothetical protein
MPNGATRRRIGVKVAKDFRDSSSLRPTLFPGSPIWVTVLPSEVYSAILRNRFSSVGAQT